jgi:NADPH:quinone reductase-like Zn-dependent oxidoreductase
MKAAVVETFEKAPRYRDCDEPVAQPDEVLVEVRAAALSQLVRAQAAGQHYSVRAKHLPFVPGADGVGRLADGTRVYFAFPRPPSGAMAERVAVKRSYTAALPDDLDDVTSAAIANPGMSSWAALTLRARFERGESVLVYGAAGASGRLAIQIAKHLGAAEVVACARNPAVEPELRALGADRFVCIAGSNDALTHSLTSTLNEASVDVVLDYLWGAPAQALLAALSTHAPGEAARRVRFVQIGSLAGAHATVPAAALRSSRLELLGSGLGSISNEELVQSVAGVLRSATAAKLHVEARALPLRDVERAWNGAAERRLVFVP